MHKEFKVLSGFQICKTLYCYKTTILLQKCKSTHQPLTPTWGRTVTKSSSVLFDLTLVGFPTSEPSHHWSFISIILNQTTMHVAHTEVLRARIISMTITRLIKRPALYTTHNVHQLCQRLPAWYTHTPRRHTCAWGKGYRSRRCKVCGLRARHNGEALSQGNRLH